jgi:hypothetical protein
MLDGCKWTWTPKVALRFRQLSYQREAGGGVVVVVAGEEEGRHEMTVPSVSSPQPTL